jgi:hypothetical protein
MAVNAGNNQTALTGAAFTTALSVTVEDSSNDPVPGVAVSFTAPVTGASGTFANNTVATQAATGANGVATATTLTANARGGGPYKVVENAPGPLTVSFMLTNTAPTVMVPSVVGDLHRYDVQSLGLQKWNDLVPAGAIGPGTVRQYNAFCRLHRFLLRTD